MKKECLMKSSLITMLIVILSIFVVAEGAQTQTTSSSQSTTKDTYGTLVVEATWNDTRATPATNIYVEAHGFVRSVGASQSFVLDAVAPGKYKLKIPPAVYDVFISDGISIPICKRFLLAPNKTVLWRVRLRGDMKYTLE